MVFGEQLAWWGVLVDGDTKGSVKGSTEWRGGTVLEARRKQSSGTAEVGKVMFTRRDVKLEDERELGGSDSSWRGTGSCGCC